MTKNVYRRVALVALAGVILSATSALGDEILVGAEIPLTGALARVGGGMNEGIAVAVELFNQTNGKHRIKVITIDDESAPAKAIAAVEKLAGQGVVAITGGYGSNNIAPASDATNRLGLPYVTSGGVDNSLTARGYKTFFRINNSTGYQKAVVGLLMDMKVKSASIIFSTKDAPSNLAKDVQKDLTARGLRIGMAPFDPALTDFKPIVNKVKLQDKPDVIVMVGYENDYVGILRAAKVLRPDVKAMVGVWSLATPQMAAQFPDLMPSVYGTALLPFPPTEFKSADGKAFAATYRKLYNKEPDYLGQFGYVQAMLLFEAIARAADRGTLTGADVAKELHKTDRETLIGRVQFDERGDNVNFIHHMGQHQDGKIVIVWPSDAATGKMKFPAVPW